MEIRCPQCESENRIPLERLGDHAKCGKCKGPLPSASTPIEVGPSEFDAALKGKLPVLVDFWAPWCPPCRMAGPQVERAAKTLSGKAIVLKVNTEAHPSLAARYRIEAIPHFMVLSGGQVVGQQSGLVPAEKLVSMVPPLD